MIILTRWMLGFSFFFFQFSSVMFALGGDKDKWFSRVALSLICAGFYAICFRLDKPNEQSINKL